MSDSKKPNLKPVSVVNDFALKVLEGEVVAPTEAIAYLAKRAREVRDEGNNLIAKEKELATQLQAVQSRVAAIAALLKQYQTDVTALIEMSAIEVASVTIADEEKDQEEEVACGPSVG